MAVRDEPIWLVCSASSLSPNAGAVWHGNGPATRAEWSCGRAIPPPERVGNRRMAHVHGGAPSPPLGDRLSDGTALWRRWIFLRSALLAHKPSAAASKFSCRRLLPRELRI